MPCGNEDPPNATLSIEGSMTFRHSSIICLRLVFMYHVPGNSSMLSSESQSNFDYNIHVMHDASQMNVDQEYFYM